MRIFCDAPVRFGLTGLFAYAGSQGYFCLRDYRIIALAPVVLWGLALLVLQLLVPESWRSVVYVIQAVNVSGSVGDLYLLIRLRNSPSEALVQDTGVGITTFMPEEV